MLRPDVIADADEPQHDPSARLARLIDLRDLHCGGPGCSSSRCDRDHLDPWPAGATSARNLGLLSPRCHSAKHHGWTLTRHPDGSLTWTSPLRRRYERPGPWGPPLEADLRSEPPPVRPRPQAPTAAGATTTGPSSNESRRTARPIGRSRRRPRLTRTCRPSDPARAALVGQGEHHPATGSLRSGTAGGGGRLASGRAGPSSRRGRQSPSVPSSSCPSSQRSGWSAWSSAPCCCGPAARRASRSTAGGGATGGR